jgi:hypothetical protein
MEDEKKPKHPRMERFQATAKDAGYATLAPAQMGLEGYAFTMDNLFKFADWIIIALLLLIGIVINVGADEHVLEIYHSAYASPMLWAWMVLLAVFWILGPIKHKESLRSYTREAIIYGLALFFLFSGKILCPETIQAATKSFWFVEKGVDVANGFWSLLPFRPHDIWMLGLIGLAVVGIKFLLLKFAVSLNKRQVAPEQD